MALAKWRCPKHRAALWIDGALLQEEPAGRDRRGKHQAAACGMLLLHLKSINARRLKINIYKHIYT